MEVIYLKIQINISFTCTNSLCFLQFKKAKNYPLHILFDPSRYFKDITFVTRAVPYPYAFIHSHYTVVIRYNCRGLLGQV